MSRYASGKHALGICDRCGLTYKLLELKEEYVKDYATGLMTCPSCYDEDHPQNHLDKVDPYDPIGLEDPRPDTGEDESVSVSGFNPIQAGEIQVFIGEVWISGS